VAASNAYLALLKDPRWQKMRLEILSRDDWTCQSCTNKEKTLNVHHRYYVRGNSPWEYPPESLVTLCEDCHEAVSVEQKLLTESCRLLREFEHGHVRGFVEALVASRDQSGIGPNASFEFIDGAALFLGVSPDEIMQRSGTDGSLSADDVRELRATGREFLNQIRRQLAAKRSKA
jgi:hypothetical protein